jgi:hypothetical protein
MDNNQKLTRRIMRRVYGLWFLRQMAPASVGMPALLAVAFWQISGAFFVSKIVENFMNSLYSGNISVIINFVSSALYGATEHFLSVLIAGFSIGLVLFLGYKLFRNFTRLTLVRI